MAASRQTPEILGDDAVIARLEAVEARLRELAASTADSLRASPLAVDSDSANARGEGEPLRRLERSLVILMERLQIGALEGFALDA